LEVNNGADEAVDASGSGFASGEKVGRQAQMERGDRKVRDGKVLVWYLSGKVWDVTGRRAGKARQEPGRAKSKSRQTGQAGQGSGCARLSPAINT
jgi:hypothetical protein